MKCADIIPSSESLDESEWENTSMVFFQGNKENGSLQYKGQFWIFECSSKYRFGATFPLFK